MPRVAIAAVKACERSQEPCGRGDCERDLPIKFVFDVDCNRCFFLILVLIGLTFLFYDFVFAIYCMF